MHTRSGSGRIGWTAVLSFGIFLLISFMLVPRAAQAQLGSFTFGLPEVRSTLFEALASEISTIPNPSGGGFTYTFDPGLGVFVRSSESFGPVFANRAETTGRGKVTLTASYSRHTFDEVDGVHLRNGDLGGLTIVQVAEFLRGDPFRVNLLSIREDVRADVYTIGALYGVTDRLDVGITVPILDISIKERVRRVAAQDCTAFGAVCLPPFAAGEDFLPSEASSTGLGDIILRAKYNVWQSAALMGGRAGVSAGVDVKLPTGDKGDRDSFNTIDANLVVGPSGTAADSQFQLGEPPRGTGIVRVKPQIIASGSWFGISPHVTVGAELGTTQGVTNDFLYEVGLDYTVFKRVTVSFDVLGRHAFGVDRVRIEEVVPGEAGSFPSLTDRKAKSDRVTASIGLKANPVGTLLVFVNFLVPLNDTGVRDGVTPTFGVEWSF